MGRYRTQNFLNNQYSRIYDSGTNETLDILGAKVKFADDFKGLYIRTAAAGYAGWTVTDTGACTEAIIANQPAGIVGLTLAANDEEEEAGLTFGDALNFNLDKGLVFEAVLSANVLPTLLSECYFGLAGAYVKGTLAAADQGPLVHVVYNLDGGGAVTIHTDDNGGSDNNAVATGVTLVATVQHVFRIDIHAVTGVRFYIDGTRVAATTTFNVSNGTNVVVQPYVMCYKSAGAGLGQLYIDSVKVWQLAR